MGEPSLAERERQLCGGMNPSQLAKRIGPTLLGIGTEMQQRARNDTERELANYYAARLKIAGELLHTLDIEQWRQRETIKLYLHGRMDMTGLRNVSDSWNGDKSHD